MKRPPDSLRALTEDFLRRHRAGVPERRALGDGGSDLISLRAYMPMSAEGLGWTGFLDLFPEAYDTQHPNN